MKEDETIKEGDGRGWFELTELRKTCRRGKAARKKFAEAVKEKVQKSGIEARMREVEGNLRRMGNDVAGDQIASRAQGWIDEIGERVAEILQSAGKETCGFKESGEGGGGKNQKEKTTWMRPRSKASEEQYKERERLSSLLQQWKEVGGLGADSGQNWVETRVAYRAACRRYARGRHRERVEERGRQCQEVQLDGGSEIDAREAWARLKRLKRGGKESSGLPTMVRDEYGELITDPLEGGHRWTRHRQGLAEQPEGNPNFNPEAVRQTREEEAELAKREEVGRVPSRDGDEWPCPKKEEVKKLLDGLPNGSSAGTDTIPYELLKYSGEAGLSMLTELLGLVWRWEVHPSAWDKAWITPQYKPGKTDKQDPNNYRGITLLNSMTKLFEGWMEQSMRAILDKGKVIAGCQGAHQKGTGCHEMAAALISGVRMRNEEGKTTYVAFVDIKTAFPATFLELTWVKLWKAGVRGRLWRSIRRLFSQAKSRVLHPHVDKDDFFEVPQGLREGSKLSPVLFNVLVNSLEEDLKKAGLGATISRGNGEGELYFGCLQFSDDVALCASSQEELQKMLDFFQNWCADNVVTINHDKTEVLEFFRREEENEGAYSMTGGDNVEHRIKVVQAFKYLGVHVDAKLTMKALRDAIVSNIIRAQKDAGKLGVKHKELELGSRLVAWKALVMPHLTAALAFLPSEQVKTVEPTYFSSICGMFSPDGEVTCIQADLGIATLEELHIQASLRLLGQLQGCPDGRLPAEIHRLACSSGREIAGLEGTCKKALEELDMGERRPRVTRPRNNERCRLGRDAQGRWMGHRQAKSDKLWWKKEVNEILAEQRPDRMERLLTGTTSQGRKMYFNLVGKRGLLRDRPFSPADWLEQEPRGWGRSRLLAHRTQGSDIFDAHAHGGSWEGGRRRWERGLIAYDQRICTAAGCANADGSGWRGDEVHTLLQCRGRENTRGLEVYPPILGNIQVLGPAELLHHQLSHVHIDGVATHASSTTRARRAARDIHLLACALAAALATFPGPGDLALAALFAERVHGLEILLLLMDWKGVGCGQEEGHPVCAVVSGSLTCENKSCWR
jgi:hypothetical protein